MDQQTVLSLGLPMTDQDLNSLVVVEISYCTSMVFQVENSLVSQPLDQTHDNPGAQVDGVVHNILHWEITRNLDLSTLTRLTQTTDLAATQMFF
jgi:hypothetical protein